MMALRQGKRWLSCQTSWQESNFNLKEITKQTPDFSVSFSHQHGTLVSLETNLWFWNSLTRFRSSFSQRDLLFISKKGLVSKETKEKVGGEEKTKLCYEELLMVILNSYEMTLESGYAIAIVMRLVTG